ncbi:hypothetical protein HY312_01735 [Candidatus Saccharibacteria bacterium]|nr:hypothetical protein [Candidatus Saccharibacteria bacterium]
MKKPTKTKNQPQALTQRMQWLIVSLLVVILFVFAFFVYGMDMIWTSNSSL